MSEIDDAREAFLNLLADARQFEFEPDGDETGDHSSFVIVTHWRQMAELAEALGIPGPGYMETWDDALQRALKQEPPAPPVAEVQQALSEGDAGVYEQ